MKVVLYLLVLLPFALSAPLTEKEKEVYRRFLGNISINDLGQQILNTLGSDTSEAACEKACPVALNAIVPGGSLVGGALCGPACHWVQSQLNG